MKHPIVAVAALSFSTAVSAGCEDLNDTASPPPDYGPFVPTPVGPTSGSPPGVPSQPTPVDGGHAIDAGQPPSGIDGAGPAPGSGWDGGGSEAGQGSEPGASVPPCVPSCAGALCGGSDGCGGTCMWACTCVPSCGPLDCGASDGCGGTCNGGCYVCIPSCGASDCGGSDGCGGTCNGGCGSDPTDCGPSGCGGIDSCDDPFGCDGIDSCDDPFGCDGTDSCDDPFGCDDQSPSEGSSDWRKRPARQMTHVQRH